MIEVKVHSVYSVRMSNQDESAFVIVLKVLEQESYLPIYTNHQITKLAATVLSGELPLWMRDEEKARGIREVLEHVRIGAAHSSIRILNRMFEGGVWHDESGGSSSLLQALLYGIPIFVEEEVLDELGVPEPSMLSQNIKSSAPFRISESD